MTSRGERSAMQRLDTILGRLDGAERRALADLRAAGFKVRSVGQARELSAGIRAAVAGEATVSALLGKWMRSGS